MRNDMLWRVVAEFFGTFWLVFGGCGAAVMTRGTAKELAGESIRVNAVAPGIILTPLHDRLTSAETMAALVKTIPMRRAGTAEECVGAYLFLSCEALSGYITGQVIEVNGGLLTP